VAQLIQGGCQIALGDLFLTGPFHNIPCCAPCGALRRSAALCHRLSRHIAQLVAHLLGHEGAGSLLSLLKREGLAEALSAGVGEGGYENNSGCCLFQVELRLTPAGATGWRRVVGAVFAYVRLLAERSVAADGDGGVAGGGGDAGAGGGGADGGGGGGSGEAGGSLLQPLSWHSRVLQELQRVNDMQYVPPAPTTDTQRSSTQRALSRVLLTRRRTYAPRLDLARCSAARSHPVPRAPAATGTASPRRWTPTTIPTPWRPGC
jgi:hypothetical protein